MVLLKNNILLGFGFYLGIGFYLSFGLYYFNVLYDKIKIEKLAIQVIILNHNNRKVKKFKEV